MKDVFMKGAGILKKMLVADNGEMNRAILQELFGKEYELIQTESSEDFLRLLMHYKSEISVILANEGIARKISADRAEMLEKLKLFDNTPVILILQNEHSNLKNKVWIPYRDVVHSPVNPYTVRKRVQNLVELFSHKNRLEHQVQEQRQKITEQDEALKVKEEKINTINNDMLDVLSMVIEYRDVESGKHVRRIQKFTEALLQELSKKYPKYHLDDEKIALITSASCMHDIGKIAIPDSILLKPSRLTPEEFQVMKMHTTKGCEILEQIDNIEKNEYYKYCYDICRFHHEKWDGLGYPDGLSGDEIPIWAQVVALADCYDALTSRRPYKEPYSHEKAVDMIRDGACGTFSEEVLDCFGMVLPKFKELAEKYVDKDVSDKKNTAAQYLKNKHGEYAEEVYAKMSRDDLIELIERQKKMLKETHQRDVDVFYASSDYVFEFGTVYDTIHERKGQIGDICGGNIPKNYEEAINLFAESCAENYRNDFLRQFRPDNIREGTVIFECVMKFGNKPYTSVRVAAIPIAENGSLVRVLISMIELHQTAFNYRQTEKDHDILTGLLNLNGMKKEIDDYLSHTGKNGYHLLVLADGDDFGKINRSTSYRFGNEILIDLAKELRKQVPDTSVVARVEDDNFLLFIKDCPDKEECLKMVDDIFRGFHKTYPFNEQVSVQTTASVGAAAYPSDGGDFDTLFAKASKAVELVKLNGKNMYMFYHDGMEESWELDQHRKPCELVRKETELCTQNFEKYLLPVVHSENGRILCYHFIETISNAECELSEGNATAMSLNSTKRLIAEIDAMQKNHIVLPKMSVMMYFGSDDCENVVSALREIVRQYPIAAHCVCILLSHDMLDHISTNRLAAFSAEVKSMGFDLGVYGAGFQNFSVKCFGEGFFDKIVFSRSFINDIAEGLCRADLLAYFISFFDRMGIAAELPSGTGEEAVRLIQSKTPVAFGIQQEELIRLDEFRKQMEVSPTVTEYPVLSHENTTLVLNEKIYDEVLEQTKCFIMEWTPRFDKIKISGSFRKLYGYEPNTEDFVKELKENRFLHEDDAEKFLEKLHAARLENSDAEAFLRVYSHKTKSYVWNKVKFVAVRNTANIPVQVIAVFADVSDESESFFDVIRNDRTEFISNLYHKRAAENKIRHCLNQETNDKNHALIIAEIGGYEELEENLGTAFANAVLKETSENMRELFGDTDMIGRSSGSRFIIFVKNMANREKLLEKAEQICLVMKNKYPSENGELAIFGKAGISVFPHDGGTYEELYANALKALDYAVREPEKNIAFVDEALQNRKRLHE